MDDDDDSRCSRARLSATAPAKGWAEVDATGVAEERVSSQGSKVCQGMNTYGCKRRRPEQLGTWTEQATAKERP